MCVFFFLSASVFLFHFLKIHYKCTRNVRRVNHKVITYLLKIENKINKLRSNFKERKSKCDLPVLWIGCNQHCFTWHNSPFRLVFFLILHKYTRRRIHAKENKQNKTISSCNVMKTNVFIVDKYFSSQNHIFHLLTLWRSFGKCANAQFFSTLNILIYVFFSSSCLLDFLLNFHR